MVSIINIVFASLLLNNFVYKYFIGVNFFDSNKTEKKHHVAFNIFMILLITFIFNQLLYAIWPKLLEVEGVMYLVNVLNVYMAVLIVNRKRRFEGRRAYYGVTVFLINLMIFMTFNTREVLLAAVFIVPLFFYLNLLFLEPLFDKLRLESKKGLVRYEVIFTIVIAMISMIFNAFIGY